MELYNGVLQVIGGASILAAFVSKRTGNKVVQTVAFVIDLLAFNWGHARNREEGYR